MRITVLGFSGFIGRYLVRALRERGDDVVEASLRDPVSAARACDGVDAVVNLAGAPVAQRWTDAAKALIRTSRIDAPRALIDGLAALRQPPHIYVSSSAVGYYGTSETKTFVESDPAGSDFLASVCVGWESEAMRATLFGMRVALVRTGVVLGTDGGALGKLLPIFRLGLGGTVATGRQWYSWIHIDDLIGIYLLAIDRGDGAYNGTAPKPERNADFTRALGSALKRPTFAPVPAFALTLMLGEGSSMLTDGQRVIPERTVAAGYTFRYASLNDALAQLTA